MIFFLLYIILYDNLSIVLKLEFFYEIKMFGRWLNDFLNICNQFLFIFRSKEDLFILYKLYDCFVYDLELEFLVWDL